MKLYILQKLVTGFSQQAPTTSAAALTDFFPNLPAMCVCENEPEYYM
jgi:hypothetical protein